MKIMLDRGARVPTRGHHIDAGLDLYARENNIIPARGSKVFDTGVHVQIPEGMAGVIISKSGLNVKHGITSEGLIDSGYTGSIVAKLYNNSDTDYEVKAGDKITQLIIIPVFIPGELEIVDSFGDTERGQNGFWEHGTMREHNCKCCIHHDSCHYRINLENIDKYSRIYYCKDYKDKDNHK